jgi:prevent-host-death family protein
MIVHPGIFAVVPNSRIIPEQQEDPMSTVTSAEFQRNLVLYQEKALHAPVTVMDNGREQVVLLSAEEYRRLKRRARHVFAAEDLTPEQMQAPDKSAMPPGHEHLDAELKDWAP